MKQNITPRDKSVDATKTAETAPAEGKAVEEALPLGSVVGRYVILDPLGSGGMGVVYAAYDPELNRRIAIKLLKPEVGRDIPARRLRLLHEAQALAQLSHPNVIAIYDVGTFGDQVFLAMELVDGLTLRQWLRVEARSWRNVVRTFQQAGEALDAAHAAGIVHRDFKPENVVVGRDGRVRVVDFGVALTDTDTASPDLVTRGEGSLQTLVTRTGALVGTPAYMAPEQRAGRGADGRSDQYSFCVSLYEALFSQRPAEDVNIPQGKFPSRLRALLQRGLRPNSDDRFASMADLLAELGRTVSPRGRWSLVAAAAVLTSAIAISSYFVVAHRRPLLCGGANEKLAGTWDPARAEAVHEAFRKTGKPYAEQTFATVHRQLDGYTQRWSQMHTEACEATRVRGEQSEQLLDLRMECLTRRLGDLKATTDLFASADSQVVQNAVRAAESLPDLDPCADAASLLATVRPPSDRNTRARVDDLRARLATARALKKAGKYREGIQLAASQAKEAEALHYRPLEAEALDLLGAVQADNGEWRLADATIRRAITAAEAGGDVEVEIRAWSNLVWDLAHEDGQLAEAHAASQHAFAIVERVGHHEKEMALLQQNLGYVYWLEHQFDEMRRCCVQALELREKVLGPDDPEVGESLNNLALAYSATGEFETARGYLQRSLAVKERALGRDHPSVGATLGNIGELLKKQGRFAEALPYQERALAIAEASLGPSHFQLAGAYVNVAEDHAALGDYAKALHYYERSAPIARAGRTLTVLSMALAGIGDAHLHLGHPEQAIAPLEEALKQPSDNPNLAPFLRTARFDLARALWETGGDHARARRLAAEALQKTPEPDAVSGPIRRQIQAWLDQHR